MAFLARTHGGDVDAPHAVTDQEAKLELESSARTPALSVVFPCHNEATRLPPTLERYLAHFPHDPHAMAVEFIVVDIGSTDGTAMAAELAADGDPRVRILRTPSHGKGFGVRAGLLAAGGTLVAFTDGDGSYGPEHLEQIVRALQQAPVAIGVRSDRQAGGILGMLRPLAGSVFNLATRLVLRLPHRDTQCGLKGFRREAAHRLLGSGRLNGFAFDAEVLFLARRFGYRVVEIPVRAAARDGSKIRLRVDALRMLADVWAVRRAADQGAYGTPMLDQLNS